ncbi:MAG: hypothetical protein K2K68_07860, partial [Duncaniella sp.]|nr:hypothetical protein [Duncaniella sp.]
MKPTTYIIVALVALGALASGVSAYLWKSTSINSLAPYEFTDSVVARKFSPLSNVAISFQSSLPENVKVYFSSGINLEVTESDEAESPCIMVSKDWLPLLDLRESGRTLDIIVDVHGLADYYEMPEKSKRMEIHLSTPSISLVLPKGTLAAISSDEKCRVQLRDMTLSHLKAAFNNRMSIERCEIDTFALKITGLNEYSTTHHGPSYDLLGINRPSVGEYEYSYLILTDTRIATAFISAVAPALTVSGPCHIDRLNIDARSVNRDNQFISLVDGVGFDELDW